MIQPAKPAAAPWLNPTRIRRQALLLAVALWLGYAATIATLGLRDRFGHLKGADFLHAYVLGTIALEHRGEALYDPQAQKEIGEQRVPQSGGDYFLPVYGPQYSLLWIPLAVLPYAWAATIWMLLSAAIYAACVYAVWQTCPNLHAYGGTVALAAAAFPGFVSLIAFGQNSALALACFTGAYLALRAKREFVAGICIGMLAWKPQLGLLPACVFGLAFISPTLCLWVAQRRGPQPVRFSRDEVDRFSAAKRTAISVAASAAEVNGPEMNAASPPQIAPRASAKLILGAILAVLAQFAAALSWYGSRPLIAYAHVSSNLSSKAQILEPRPYLMHSLRAFWNLLLPWPGAAFILYLLTALAALLLAIACWSRPSPLEHRYAVMLLATVLVAPHLTVYDLVILAPAFLWIADWLQVHTAPRIARLLYLSYFLPFAGPLSRWSHVQLSVICLASLTLILALPRAAQEPV